MKKNILILSDDVDLSTTEVCMWLKSFGETFLRINRHDEINILDVSINNGQHSTKFKIYGKEYEVEDFKSYWFRRGSLDLCVPELTESQINQSRFDYSQSIKQVVNENLRVSEYIHFLIDNKIKSLCSFNKRHNNKLVHLQIAGSIGLKTPDTYIETKKERIIKLLEIYPQGIITKVISDSNQFCILKKGIEFYYAIYTNKIERNELADFPEEFPITLIQPVITKKADIRSFYIEGKFYSMAIFSQTDEQTNIDFRRYNYIKPNRTIPFKLPPEIEIKLDKFMKEVGLNTGSIDLIYAEDKSFKFLEVNPVGQFGMVSVPCNYYLEKRIAEFLMYT